MSVRWVLALIGAIFVVALSASDAAAQRRPSLDNFPSPQQVRQDIRSNARGETDLTVSAREAGRYLMLANTLSNIYGFNRDRWPTSAKRLYQEYVDAYGAVVARINPSLETSGCPRAGFCRRRHFYETSTDYQYDEGPATEVARLYFPQSERAQFIDLSGGTGGRAEQAEEMAQRRAEMQAAEATRKAKAAQEREGVLTFLFWVGVIVAALVLLFLVMIRKKKKQGDDAQKAEAETVQRFIAQFDVPGLTRLQAIEKIFNEKTVSVDLHLDWRSGATIKSINCRLSRALASMSQRDREALKAAVILRHEGLHITEHNTWIQILAFVFGDGKATVIGGGRYVGFDESDESVKSPKRKVQWLVGDNGVESAYSLVLSELAHAVSQAPDNTHVQQAATRLLGQDSEIAVPEGLVPVDLAAPPPNTLILGCGEGPSAQLFGYGGEGHLITVAPSRTGKSQCHVIPNLLTWDGPAFVLDVKNELYDATSGWRAANVGPVFKFNPLEPEDSHRYNPLAEVSDQPNRLWEDSRFLADMLILPSGARDTFWDNKARDVLTAAIARTVSRFEPNERGLDKVLDVVHGGAWDQFLIDLEASSLATMRRASQSLGQMEDRAKDGVLQTLLTNLSSWEGDSIGEATSASDWRPEDLRSGTNPTVYICLRPNQISTYIPLLRVLIAQHIRKLTGSLPPRGTKPILFFLDELPQLRAMKPVEEALEIGAQYGLKIWMFAQTMGQMKNAYPNADSMVGSCAVRCFMNPGMQDDLAQNLAKEFGLRESVIDGSRINMVEPTTLAGPDFKDRVIVMATSAKPGVLEKRYAHADPELASRLKLPPVAVDMEGRRDRG
jgi:type IV secretion system protein VirD4